MAGLWLTKRMCFWTKHRRYLQLLWIVVILSALTENASSNGISADVTITPSPARPHTWVKLRCTFNLTVAQTTLLYWGDRHGDTLYIYEQGKPLRYGPKYNSGQIRNVVTNAGDHSLELYVDGCKKDPYKCDIWRDTNEKIKQGWLSIENIPKPVITQDGKPVSDFDITVNTTYKLGCKVENATQKHNLTMKVEGLDLQTAPAPADSDYDSACLYSSKMEKEFMLTDVDDFRITCEGRFADGNMTVAIAASPNMGSSTQMDIPLWVIIVVAVVAGIIVIAIVTIIAVCAVKKKKGMRNSAKQGNGTLPTKSDFQYSRGDIESQTKSPDPNAYENVPKQNQMDTAIPPQNPEKVDRL